jgi:hypothetical protein
MPGFCLSEPVQRLTCCISYGHKSADLSEQGRRGARRPLNCDPLDLIERDLIAGAVVELGRARAFVCCHGLGILERAAGLEIGGNAGRAKHVTAELDLEPGISRAPAHHAIGVDPVHRLVGQNIGLADRRAEEGGLAGLSDAGRCEILIDEGFELVVRRHLVALAAFLMQSHPPARLPAG